MKEEPLLVPHARINSFCSLKKIDAPNLPDDVPSILPEMDAVVDQLPVSIVTEKNVADFIAARSYHSVYGFSTEQSSSICYQTNYSQYCLRRRDERACSQGALAVETHGV